MYRAKVCIVVASLFKLFPAETDKFRFDAALKIEVPNQVGFLFVRVAALFARKTATIVHFVFAHPQSGQVQVAVVTYK